MSRLPSWTDEEPGLSTVRWEVERLARRALARWWLTLLVTLLGAAAVVGMRVRHTRSYASRMVFRVTEGDLDAATAPRPAKRLREYVLDVAFSNQRLLDVIRQHNLYPREYRRDPTYAIDAIRDDLEVEVWRNYFMEARQDDDAGRSARIAIRYQHKDPDQALEVVRHLGRLIAEQEASSRIAMAEEAARQLGLAVTELREQLVRRQQEILTKELASRRAPTAQAQAMLRVEIEDLKKSVEPVETELGNLTQKQASFDLRAAMERNRLGLEFEIVDPGQPARLGLSRPRELTLIGVVAFLFLLPLAGLFVGAFDPRVYDSDDLRRLGIEPLGHVGHFPGDNAFALDARLGDDRVH